MYLVQSFWWGEERIREKDKEIKREMRIVFCLVGFVVDLVEGLDSEVYGCRGCLFGLRKRKS